MLEVAGGERVELAQQLAREQRADRGQRAFRGVESTLMELGQFAVGARRVGRHAVERIARDGDFEIERAVAEARERAVALEVRLAALAEAREQEAREREQEARVREEEAEDAAE